jgi:hypothetical protein
MVLFLLQGHALTFRYEVHPSAHGKALCAEKYWVLATCISCEKRGDFHFLSSDEIYFHEDL